MFLFAEISSAILQTLGLELPVPETSTG